MQKKGLRRNSYSKPDPSMKFDEATMHKKQQGNQYRSKNSEREKNIYMC